jgi:murein DD-endopeptidase MepM/ murein hydrolase activator NlpD
MSGPAREKRARKKGLLARLRSRYRLVLIDDGSFEERFSLKLNRLSVLVFAVVTFLLYGALIAAVIVLTPLKRFIPGYSDQETKLNAFQSTVLADSLELAMRDQEAYIANLRSILSGALPSDSVAKLSPSDIKPKPEDLLPSGTEQMLRTRVDQEEQYSLVEGKGASERRELATVLFMPPVRGIVTSGFDPGAGHYGVDVVTPAEEAVKACLAGTVTLASWTTSDGHVLHVQHSNGLSSVYKHNRVLLRKVGDRVKAGEAIAIVGNTGENSTGPHLHFELWHNGDAVDPGAYMAFE